MKCAIFDLDGTLLDSMWVWENIDIEFLQSYGKTPDSDFRKSLRTVSVRQAAEMFRATFGLERSVREIISEIALLGAEKYASSVLLKPYVLEFLTRLKQKNVKMCIATASIRKNVISALTRLEVLDFFDFIIAGDDVETGKDNPRIYIMCAEKLGAERCNIVVFEDSLHAARTAKAAGFIVAGVYDESSECDKEALNELCDYYINDFSETEGMF